MTTADANQCFICKKPDQAPNIVPYYTAAGHKWAHSVCMPIPETTFAANCDLQSGGAK